MNNHGNKPITLNINLKRLRARHFKKLDEERVYFDLILFENKKGPIVGNARVP